MPDDDVEQQPAGGDPIVESSLSGPLLVASVLLFLSLGWALYDELIVQRPWKRSQRDFARLYESHLTRLGPRQVAAEKAARSSDEYRRIEQELNTAEGAVAARVAAIDKELGAIRLNLAALKDPYQDARARIAALTYELDHAGDEGRKKSIRQDIEQVRNRVSYAEMERRFTDLKTREARLNAERAEITRAPREIRRRLNGHLSDQVAGVGQQQIDGLLRKARQSPVEIRQIHVEEAGLIDRCESCHLGIREPVILTAADMGGRREFVSHPNRQLLQIHDPARFGCSPCHNGNGLATAGVEQAHGSYKHWLWPLFPKENSEAGCLQCHFEDRVLDYAPVLTRGRDLYELKGCIGCHRYEGFDRATDALTAARKDIQTLGTRQKEMRLEAGREEKLGDAAQDNAAAQRHYAAAEVLRVNASGLDAKVEALDLRTKELMQDQKKIGPNLKDVRLKLRREWVPAWIKDPPAFRPGTKMPKFRLTDDEVRALSAFVWQSAFDGPRLPPQPAGNAATGKELFETRGCLGCHSIGEGNNRIGGEFAANLSRLGEKASYDYIVRWVHNPRDRTRPYCPEEKRDLGPEDYAKHGLPFAFDLEHSTCPNDGRQLQVQNMTVMPSFRLTEAEARDIATYLTSLRGAGTYSQNTAFMDDAALARRGRDLATRYGCAGCHEIARMEDAQRIGTELTKEASKPMEQLDFGLLEHRAKGAGWYNHSGFFENKLRNPAVYDEGREKAPEERLRMPKPELADADIRALSTFLLGSMDSPFRAQFRTIPEQFRAVATDQRRDIQEGWWLIKKYNCMGCHTVQAGQKSSLSAVPRYQDPDWKEQLPPSLVQEGARVNPEWLARFLSNPALDDAGASRNGVRTYLHARMPTFHFSPNEIRMLVRFFSALAQQPQPYLRQAVAPLSDRERDMARALFTSTGAPCLKCHLVGNPAHDRFATAPNFLAAKDRLKPGWTHRWLLDPQAISPGTAMPSGLFRREGERWVFAGPTPPIFQGYTKDHADLLVRYMLQLSPEEQRRLFGR